MATSTRIVQWASRSGKLIQVTVTVSRGPAPPPGGPGPVESVRLVAEADGRVMGESRAGIEPVPAGAPAMLAGLIGRLGLTAETRARVEAALAEASAEAAADA